MIVQPDFLEHWKTRQLIEITSDESAPLAVIRLWAHCQHNKRSKFPDMTPAQLASICRWGARKPACHVALTKAGYVDKLTPKGFAAHEWDEHNRQLTQKWEAGKNGGRPAKEEKANECTPSDKPTDNRPITDRELDRPDQTRSDETRLEQTKPERTEAPPVSQPHGGIDPFDAGNGSDGVNGLAGGLVASIAAKTTRRPTLEEIEVVLKMHFRGAERYAKSFLKAMTKSSWRDKKGEQIHDWKAVAKSYASTTALRQNQP